ncbi:YcnI family protein [Gordonia sp. CPCC 205333]|uniref:YcnI family copper-binding membrane protein n=1 Tax=Gordonia sp. CPCC 205333 TaxID=3140790 RepID=UPI003AF3885B
MSSSNLSRSLLRRVAVPVAVVAAAATTALAGAGTAAAHVSVSSSTATQGGYGVVTLLVPNESDAGAATTKVSIEIPRLKGLRTESVPGWRAVIDKDPKTEEVLRVTWTASDGNAGVKVGEFGEFSIAGGPFPSQPTVNLPAVQTYANGEVVNWNQQAGADGTEPEHPTPSVTLPAGEAGDAHSASHTSTANETEDQSASASDNTARWIGGIGLVLGALGVVVGVGALARRGRAAGKSTSGGDDA